jgi:hypothetical protein
MNRKGDSHTSIIPYTESLREKLTFSWNHFHRNLILRQQSRTKIIVFRLAYILSKGKDKAVPLQAWSGPEGSRKLRFPDYVTMAQDGGKVVSLKHRPPLPLGNAPDTHFC